jgi:hypothetical protein
VSLGQQAILFHCFAGCDQQSVLAALAHEGVDATSLFSGSAATDGPEPARTREPSAAALRIWQDAQAIEALSAMGLSSSDAVRSLFHRIVADQAFPLELRVPNANRPAELQPVDK